MKKKYLLLLLVNLCILACVLGLAACGNNSGGPEPHTHVYKETVIAPTCTEQGYTLYTCECGESYKDNFTTKEHNYSEYFSEYACGDTQTYRFRYCLDCAHIDSFITDETTIHPHKFVAMEQVPPTCSAYGVAVGFKCDVCGYECKKLISPLGHITGDTKYYSDNTYHYSICKRNGCNVHIFERHIKSPYISLKMPTCTESGYGVYLCAGCGEKVTETLHPRHRYVPQEIQPATCTQGRIVERKCSQCGDVKTYTGSPLGHKWTQNRVIKEPDCTHEGEVEYKCSRCGETKPEALPIQHDFDKPVIIKPSTCTENGEQTLTCKKCGYTFTQIILAGHHWNDGETVTEATCTEEGAVLYTCTVCGATEVRETKALGHIEVSNKKSPTCEEDGYDLTVCSRCGEILDGYFMPALGHDLGIKYKFNDEGHWKECSRCPYKTQSEAHELELTVKTVKQGGEYLHILCDACTTVGCEYMTNVREIVHEHFDTAIINPTVTCVEDGYSAGLRCAVEGCGKVLIAPVAVPARGHNFINGECENYNYIGGRYVRCGEIDYDAKQTVGLEYSQAEGSNAYYVSGMGTATDTDIVIAATHNGQPVTGIGEKAFLNCDKITRVRMSGNITGIGQSAFAGCLSLSEISLSANITYIGDGAFAWDESLQSVVIPAKTLQIGADAFLACRSLGKVVFLEGDSEYEDDKIALYGSIFKDCTKLESVVLSSKFTSIGPGMFAGCRSLKNIKIPDSVTELYISAFAGCESLTSLSLGANVTAIYGYNGFDSFTNYTPIGSGNYTNLTSLSIKSNSVYCSVSNCIIETATKKLIWGCASSVIPEDGSVSAIGDCAFALCSGLNEIVIPSQVTEIGNFAFYGCSGLFRIRIPATVENIGDSAFGYCLKLTVFMEEPKNPQDVENGYPPVWVGNYPYLPVIQNPVVLENSPKIVNIDGIEYWDDMNGNAIVKGVSGKLRGTVMVAGKVTINGYVCKVTHIDMGAFDNCRNITEIVLPESLIWIGDFAFKDCTSLTGIIIPKRVWHIGGGIFYGCKKLTSITVDSANTNFSCTNNCIVDSYKRVVAGCKTSVIPSDGSVNEIQSYAFAGSSLEGIIIPASVTIIHEGAFLGCENLAFATIENSGISIAAGAFVNCLVLDNIFYGGTSEQWNSNYMNQIFFSEMYGMPKYYYILECTDGVFKNYNVEMG